MSGVIVWGWALLALLQARCARAQDPQNNTLCGTSSFYNSTDPSVPYSFNNNAWGANGNAWGAGDIEGYSCLTVGDGGQNWSVTYKWEGDASTVKGFPYMKAWPSNLPVQLWNVSSLPFSAKWKIYVEGTEDASPEEQAVAYDNAALYANVAVDMFLSDNITNSTEIGPPIEIMIWPWYTPGVLPLGHADSTPEIDTVEISGMNYSLYQGYNIQGQHVFSWLAHKNVTEIDVDYAPLLKYIMKKGMLGGGLYLGQLEYGTEVMNANEDTTFETWDYDLRIIRQGDPGAPSSTTSTLSSTGAPTSTGNSTAATRSVTATGTSAPATSLSIASSLSLTWDRGGSAAIGIWACIALLSASWPLLAYSI